MAPHEQYQQKPNQPFKYNQGLLRRKKEARSLKLLEKSIGSKASNTGQLKEYMEED